MYGAVLCIGVWVIFFVIAEIIGGGSCSVCKGNSECCSKVMHVKTVMSVIRNMLWMLLVVLLIILAHQQ